MPKQITVNDFSDIKYGTSETLIKEIKEFIKEGGNMDLPIYHGDSSLMTFSEFLNKYYREETKTILREIVSDDNNNSNNLLEFTWNAETGSVKFPVNFNFNWYRSNLGNYVHYKDKDEDSKSTCIEMLKKLFEKLPPNYKDIKEIIDSDGDILRKDNDNESAISYLVDQMQSYEVYNLLFNKYPDIKKEYKDVLVAKYNRQKDFKFAVIISELRNNSNEIAGEMYLQDIITKEYLDKNKDKTLGILNHFVLTNNLDGMKKMLNEIDLKSIEKEAKYVSDLPLYYVRSLEATQILVDHKAIEFVMLSNMNNPFTVLASNDTIKYDIETIKLLINSYPSIKELCSNPQDAAAIFNKIENIDTGIDFLAYVFEQKLVNPKDIEILDLIYEKTRFSYNNAERSTKILDILNGKLKDYEFNLNDCNKLCEKLIRLREDGLKVIRDFNKNKIIDIKNPDFLYSFFDVDCSITQNFHNYFDKLDKDVFNKKTSKGIPVWWAGKTEEIRKIMIKKSTDLNQESSNGEKYWFHIIKKDSLSRNRKYEKAITEVIYKKIDIDLNYKDNLGNNVMHYLLKVGNTDYHSDLEMNTVETFIKMMKEQNNHIDFKPNNKNILPLEQLLPLKSDKWSIKKYLNSVVERLPFEVKTSNDIYLFIELSQGLHDEAQAQQVMKQGQIFLLDKNLKIQGDQKSKNKI